MTKVIRFPGPGVHHDDSDASSSSSGRRPAACGCRSFDPSSATSLGADGIGGEQPASTSDTTVPAFVRAMADGLREPGLPDPAMVVACALRWTNSRGRRLSSLPKLIRAQLDMLCDAADPTAMLVRDWIMGRGPRDLAVDDETGLECPTVGDAHESGRM